MSYANVRQKITEQAKPEPQVNLGCYATGCPCRATMSVEGGRWCCLAHATQHSDRWPAITQKLREHVWLIEFIDEIKTMHRRLEDWRGFAVQFWDGEDKACKPDPKEEFAPYENRMRGELLHRCGLMKRPALRLPKPVKPGGFRFDRLAA